MPFLDHVLGALSVRHYRKEDGMQTFEPNGHGELVPPARAATAPIAIRAASSPSEYPLVVVEWHDAWFDVDQVGVDDCRSDYPVRTVGFLLREGPEFLSLAQEILPEGEGFRAVTHIPLAIVERMHWLSPRES
jgi:hypothetical protein